MAEEKGRSAQKGNPMEIFAGDSSQAADDLASAQKAEELAEFQAGKRRFYDLWGDVLAEGDWGDTTPDLGWDE